MNTYLPEPQKVLGALHILSFSTLLGTDLYQTFFLTGIAFRSLPRAAFTTLQKRVFPVYFRLQTGLVLLAAVTVPWRGLHGVPALDGGLGQNSGQSLGAGEGTLASLASSGGLGLLQSKYDWIPFLVAGGTAVLNLVVYEPRTRRAMMERIHQETRERRARGSSNGYGTAGTAAAAETVDAQIGGAAGTVKLGEPSPEMKRLNRLFSKNHAMTIHLNLVSIAAMVFYACRLATRL